MENRFVEDLFGHGGGKKRKTGFGCIVVDENVVKGGREHERMNMVIVDFFEKQIEGDSVEGKDGNRRGYQGEQGKQERIQNHILYCLRKNTLYCLVYFYQFMFILCEP